MPHTSLGEFLSALQDNKDLVRVTATVDSALEISAITDRVTKTSPYGGPAILFESVKNSTIPVVTNLLGSRSRLCRCLGIADLEELSASLDRRLQGEATGWIDSLKLVPGWGGLNKYAPKSVKSAVCQQVVRLGRDVSLWDLPIPRCWPEEQHPVITSGQIVSRDPATGTAYHCQSPLVVTGPNELGWYDGDNRTKAILNSAAALKQNLPVSISLGGDPVLHLAISQPGIADVRSFAGMLRGAGIEVVRSRTNELDVPAGAEIIIEGYVDAANPLTSASLSVARGNGRYVNRRLPLIQVTAVTHRANPVLPAMITARPPSEESWMVLAAERIGLPVLKRQLPEIVDIRQPFHSAGRNLLFVSIRKTVEHQARRVLHALWGMESIGQTKTIVIVDANVDLLQEEQVWFTVGVNACPSRDFLFADGLARDDDYTPLAMAFASRVGIDATKKLANESATPWPESLNMSDEMLNRVQERWTEYGMA